MKKVLRCWRVNRTGPASLALLLCPALLTGEWSALAAGEVAAERAGAELMRHPPAGIRSYLPTLGPSPLRLYSPAPPMHAAQLPPLAMTDPPPESAGASGGLEPAFQGPPLPPGFSYQSPAPAAPDTAGNPPVPPEPMGPAEPPPVGDGSAVPPVGAPGGLLAAGFENAPPGAIITPQMLVQFFKPTGSNYQGGGWSVPVFVPPSAPATTRPSTATYRSQ